MEITFLTVGDINTASSRFRVYQLIPYLEKEGFKCKVIPSPLNSRIRVALILIWKAIFCRILFIQKVTPPKIFTSFLRIVANFTGTKIVYDFDDAVYADPPKGKRQRAKIERLDYLIKNADLVIVGNKILKNYAERLNTKVEVVPTSIDTSQYKPKTSKSPQGKVVLGWIGHPANLRYLAKISNTLRRINRKLGNKLLLKVVSSEKFYCEGIKVINKEWSLADEIKDLQGFDIGLSPLEDTEWGRGKCGFRAIEFMSVSIPVVVSPVGVNKEIVTHGVNGFHAKTDDEWVKNISLLVENPELRRKLGKRAREKVEKEYSAHLVALRVVNIMRGLFFPNQLALFR